MFNLNNIIMKKVLFVLFAATALIATACKDDQEKLINVPVQLTQFGDSLKVVAPVEVVSAMATYKQTTDENGIANFRIPLGSYKANVSFKQGNSNFNGSKDFVIDETFAETDTVKVPVVASNTSDLIIKELYNGGCKQNNGTSNYINDKYIIIYNNSDKEVDASRMCLTMAQITNTASSNKYPITAGVIEYEAAGWTPANYGIWWFQDGTQVKIPPYSQISIAITGAIDHTVTYTNSVDLSGVDYCLYDPDSGFNGAAQYPAPSASIPSSHYMKTYEFGMGTAWAMPLNNAAPYILIPEEGVDITKWVKVEGNFDQRGSNKSTNYAKVPTSWILDALEEWSAADDSKFILRFPAAVNTGYTVMTNGMGYSQYRNVDKEATEAIADNAGKLVYNYSGAVSEDDTDPSGIDAEASIAAGAKIVYMDTNNSANDFHQRKVASLKK